LGRRKNRVGNKESHVRGEEKGVVVPNILGKVKLLRAETTTCERGEGFSIKK